MTAAQGLRLYRPLILNPSQMIDEVDIKIVVAASARPDEAMEALHLVQQVGNTSRFGQGEEISAGAMHAVTTLQNDFADLAVMHTVSQFLQRPAVTRHEPYSHLEVLG